VRLLWSLCAWRSLSAASGYHTLPAQEPISVTTTRHRVNAAHRLTPEPPPHVFICVHLHWLPLLRWCHTCVYSPRTSPAQPTMAKTALPGLPCGHPAPAATCTPIGAGGCAHLCTTPSCACGTVQTPGCVPFSGVGVVFGGWVLGHSRVQVFACCAITPNCSQRTSDAPRARPPMPIAQQHPRC